MFPVEFKCNGHLATPKVEVLRHIGVSDKLIRTLRDFDPGNALIISDTCRDTLIDELTEALEANVPSIRSRYAEDLAKIAELLKKIRTPGEMGLFFYHLGDWEG